MNLSPNHTFQMTALRSLARQGLIVFFGAYVWNMENDEEFKVYNMTLPNPRWNRPVGVCCILNLIMRSRTGS